MSNLWHRIQAAAGAGLVLLATLQPSLTGKVGQFATILLGIAALVGADPKKLKGAPPAALLLLALPLLHGCAFFQKPGTQKAVKCTEDVVSTCGASLAQLASCLDVSSPTACVLAVGQAAGCAGKEALACRVHEAAAPPVSSAGIAVSMTVRQGFIDDQEASAQRQVVAKRVYAELGVRPEEP